MIDTLVDMGAPLNAANARGETAIMRSILAGHRSWDASRPTEVVEVLIDEGADVNHIFCARVLFQFQVLGIE